MSQVLAAIGLGGVASVSFSVVSDLISPKRRGLVMSFWGLSQGVGTLAGTLVGGLLGSSDWRRPFLIVAVAGVIATIAYLFTYNVPRGDSQPELEGVEYDERIARDDLPRILRRRTNVWLILQGFSAQVAFGSLVWLPVLFRARAEDQGYSASTAVIVGQRLRHAVPARRGVVDPRGAGRRPSATAYVSGPGLGRSRRRPRRRALLRGFVLRAVQDRRAGRRQHRRGHPARSWATW